MQTIFELIGIIGTVILIMLTIFKVIETVSFFQEFRRQVRDSLERIEKSLKNDKL